MSTVTVGLAALSIVTPALPSTATTISVDTSVLALVINADTNTLAIDVVVGTLTTTLTDFTLVNGQNQFTGSVAVGSTASIQVVEVSGRNYLDGTNPTAPLISPTIQFQLLFSQSNLGTSIAPPSGITIYKGASTCRVEWALPTIPGFQGVRVQWSTDASGVTVPFQQYGNIENNVTRSADVTLSGPTTATASTPNPTVTGQQPTNNVITTSTSITTTTNYDSVNIPFAVVNADIFFVVLTTLVQDPVTNQVYESQAAGPFTAGYVNLKVVNPTDFLALQKSNDIASRMIAEMNRRRPDLDLTPRAEFRDCVINPIALELANMSVREWFSRCAVSISALAQIDDQDGDGVSDPVASSSIKQQIAQAYGLSQTAVQSFINQRFVVLGEQAGVPQGGATTSVVMLTFYTFNLPTAPITIPLNMVCSTIPDTANPTAVSFVTRGTATIDSRNAASFFSVENGWWSVSVPAEAQVAGSSGNVGAETIVQITTGGPSGVSVINENAANGGSDIQSNSDFAAMIQNRQVVGKDSGTRNGYWETAMGISGIIDALIVAAGDTDMLRDWSAVMQKHTFGCVDVYARGLTSSQQTEDVPFQFGASSTYGIYSTYLNCTLADSSHLSFKIGGFSALGAPIYTAVEMVAISGGRMVWLGTDNAQFDNTNGLIFLNPADQPFTVNSDGSTTIWQINGVNATNQQFITAAGSNQVTYSLMVRLQDGIDHIPALQPVTTVNGITGPTTGSLPLDDIELVHTTDFLLTGGSNEANDAVIVPGTLTQQIENTLTLATATVTIDSDMSVGVDANGNPMNILSVRSTDLSTVYTFGIDYSIIGSGKYRTYSLQVLNDATTGNPRIPLGSTSQVVVAYNQFLLREFVTLQNENVTLSGSTPSTLSNDGFIQNIWIPFTHGQTALLLDGQSVNGQAPTGLIGAGVAPASRYIKVTFNNGATNVILIEGRDFTLTVDPTSGAATLTRVLGGGIPDGGTVAVSYYTVEVLEVATEYPAFVQQLVTAINATKHAAADVLVKAMIANPVDIVMNVELNDATTPEGVDGTIHTALDLVINAASNKLDQSELVRQVRAVTGVAAVQLPLLKCARADGSYDIGVVIPTGTAWDVLKLDSLFTPLALPAMSFISNTALLPNPTIPSGGTPNSYVGLLFEGQSYRRALSVQDFLTSTVPSFYIIGADDEINAAIQLPSNYSGKILLTTPNSSIDPSSLSYRVTYQVFGAASSDDIMVASSEFLVPGTITINYVTES